MFEVSEVRVEGLKFRVCDSRFRVCGSGFQVWSLGLRNWGLGNHPFGNMISIVKNGFRACGFINGVPARRK
jgi:hypothetical protein